MLNWTKGFLDRCLEEIPAGNYRSRLHAELEDHLVSLAADLESAGFDRQGAQAAALERMGDPASLNRGYRMAWARHPERALWMLKRMVWGCLLAGICYLLAAGILGALGYTYDQVYLDRTSLPMIGHPDRCTVFGAATYLAGALAETGFLRRLFRRERHRRIWVTLGLLLAWTFEKTAILLLSAAIYDMSPFPLGDLVLRISQGGDQTAPWFSGAYLLWTLAACLTLGLVLGGKDRSTVSGPTEPVEQGTVTSP